MVSGENGYNGLTFKEILSKIRVNYNKTTALKSMTDQEPHESWDELIKNHALYLGIIIHLSFCLVAVKTAIIY